MLRSVVTALFALACLTAPALAGSGGHLGLGSVHHATHPIGKTPPKTKAATLAPIRDDSVAKNAVTLAKVCGPARSLCERALLVTSSAEAIYLVQTGHAPHIRGQPGLLIDAARMDVLGPIKAIILRSDPRWNLFFMRYKQQFTGNFLDSPHHFSY